MTAVITPCEPDSKRAGSVLFFARIAERSIRVLPIADNGEHAEWIALFLSDEAGELFAVERTACLEQAMDRLSRPNFDVILLDLGMPELTGHRSYAALRAA
jgi:DNA-binding response OmpR family regulator